MTSLIFNFCNILILIAWGAIIISPQKKISEILISYPWIPLTLSFFYIYFIIISGGLMEADLSSLNGIVTLFKNATPESAAAGWLHYLAFDFWVGTWIIKHSRKEKISNKIIVLPLLFTFILGPVGILVYSLILLAKKSFSQASET
tara:strand:+ start:5528 stop:5965 length:438 start_codon:yes stop_codon:yes gene_type:complete